MQHVPFHLHHCWVQTGLQSKPLSHRAVRQPGDAVQVQTTAAFHKSVADLPVSIMRVYQRSRVNLMLSFCQQSELESF